MTLWIRLRSQVVERLGPRLMEWEHAIFLMLVGLLMAQSGALLGSLPNEDGFGWFLFALGLMRLVSLIVNGLKQQVTASLRAISAILSSALFILVGIGYVYSGRWGLVLAFFPVIAAFELFNYARAMRDVGRSV